MPLHGAGSFDDESVHSGNLKYGLLSTEGVQIAVQTRIKQPHRPAISTYPLGRKSMMIGTAVFAFLY